MNLYEKCKGCGDKHPSVYLGSNCLACRTKVTWHDVCIKVVGEYDEQEKD